MGLPRWVKSSDALLNTVSQHYNPTLSSSTQHSPFIPSNSLRYAKHTRSPSDSTNTLDPSFHPSPSHFTLFTQICKAYKISQDAGLGVLFWMYSLYHIYMPLIQTNSKHLGTCAYPSSSLTILSYLLCYALHTNQLQTFRFVPRSLLPQSLLFLSIFHISFLSCFSPPITFLTSVSPSLYLPCTLFCLSHLTCVY